MRDILQAQTEGTTSAQQSAGATEDHPANVVKYSYPNGDTGFTDVVPQDTPTGELPSATDQQGALDAQNNTNNAPPLIEASGGTDGGDTSSIGTPDDAGIALDSGDGASAEASADSVDGLPSEFSAYDESQVKVTPLIDADLVEGADEARLVADNQVSVDDTPRKAKKAVA